MSGSQPGRGSKRRPMQKDQPLPSSKRPDFQTHTRLAQNKTLGHGYRGDMKPGTTALARTKSNPTDQPAWVIPLLSSKRSPHFKIRESWKRTKYGHRFRRTLNQDWLCWREPAAIYPTDQPGGGGVSPWRNWFVRSKVFTAAHPRRLQSINL
jgi:hypothetical protein